MRAAADAKRHGVGRSSTGHRYRARYPRANGLTAARYTTSAFMRLKLGEALKDRDVAPHVFETRREAQAGCVESPPNNPQSASKSSPGRKKASARTADQGGNRGLWP